MSQTVRDVIAAIASVAGVLIGGELGRMLDQELAGMFVGALVVFVAIWRFNRRGRSEDERQ